MKKKIEKIEWTELVNWLVQNQDVPHKHWGVQTWHPNFWDAIWGLMKFTDIYCKFPRGFAETDNVEDPLICLEAIQEFNISLHTCSSKSELKGFLNQEIQKQMVRLETGNNSTSLGRFTGRLMYLLSKQKQLSSI